MTIGVTGSRDAAGNSAAPAAARNSLRRSIRGARNRVILLASMRAAGLGLLAAATTALCEPITFYKDVLPVLQNRCQTCHRPGEIGPMPFRTYAETRPWAKAIRQAVLLRRMPPWLADPHYGAFRNDPSLSAKEIDIIRRWVDSGAPAGDPATAPPAPPIADGWRIPNPDVIFEMPQEFEVSASGVVDYQYFTVPTCFTEDKWVQMAEVRPADRSVVHHGIVMINDAAPDRWRGGREYLAGYAPGMSPQTWPEGQARLIRAGSSLTFQMHYTANGKTRRDRTRIGLVFAKSPPKERIVAVTASHYWLDIPPGAPNYSVDSFATLYEPARLVGMRAHMHLRGKSFEFRVTYPGAEPRIVLRIPKYSFEWQPYYYLDKPISLPAGSRIECTAVYDNSSNNPRNPDPTAEVHWGEQSWDEMMIGWLDIAVPIDRPVRSHPLGVE